ncbi:uncharacterized protein LOC119908735 [Micropterus salmoides]|uniref:uncharacterized protein LOC119908735 n=1 Tax=Micropterus salmoides TaxID=27706 RepID=UPI0018EDF510|nr:uncharacterized protein LOC119908735 [Micropterus salmoides]
MKRSQHSCSATVTFTTSDFNQKSKHPELFKCNVTDSYTKKVQLFPFSPQSSGGDATTTRSILTAAQTTTTMVTTTKQEGDGATTTESPKTITSTWETRNTWTSVKKITSAGTNNNDQTKQKGLSQVQLTFIIVSVGLAALMIIAVVVIRWKRTKGNKTHMNGNMADPEDGVSYASISYTGKTNSKGRVRGDDEDDAVTYMKVKASSSSAGASADPSSLYATIN